MNEFKGVRRFNSFNSGRGWPSGGFIWARPRSRRVWGQSPKGVICLSRGRKAAVSASQDERAAPAATPAFPFRSQACRRYAARGTLLIPFARADAHASHKFRPGARTSSQLSSISLRVPRSGPDSPGGIFMEHRTFVVPPGATPSRALCPQFPHWKASTPRSGVGRCRNGAPELRLKKRDCTAG